MATPQIELIATSWTSAGNVAPLMPNEQSPFDILDRVRAVAETGWAGIGIAAADVRKVGDTIGFATLRQAIGDAGLTYTEVEMLIDWWEAGEKRAKSDQVRELLFTAAQGLGANHVKIASGLGASGVHRRSGRAAARTCRRRGGPRPAGRDRADALLHGVHRADRCGPDPGGRSAQLWCAH